MIVSLEECKPVEEKPREVDRRQLFPGQEISTVSGGDGISFSLGGRSALQLPSPEYPRKKSGTVVVEVTVDRNGNVTNARGGVRGSTTNDTELVNAAEGAARRARFDVNQNAAAYQTGTITYVFKLQN
ncbi:MAG: TonB family protein [Tenuifilaceae bacterium]|nr:TonB family protein [Tenuifilaceae bacterium]